MGRLFQFPNSYYAFTKPKGFEKLYSFETINKITYRVQFKATPNVFGDNKPYSDLLFEISILEVFKGQQSYVRDDLISSTIVAIILDFYSRQNQNICFYICEFSDDKHYVRFRKFDGWFREFSKNVFLKLDGSLKTYDDEPVPASLIMLENNPYKNEILIAFGNFLTDFNEC